MANAITIGRILCSLALLFPKPWSPAFIVLYLAGGLSDMLDGYVARKTGTESDTGAKLDSLADLLFLTVCLIKLLPVMKIPAWLWIWMGIIAAVRIGNLFIGYLREKRLLMLHIRENRITGCLLFLLPLALPFTGLTIPAVIVCTAASAATAREGWCIIKKRALQ